MWTKAAAQQERAYEQRLLAAIAAALLGGQGSPAWSRTAEALLFACPEVSRRYRQALREVEATLETPSG